MESGQTKPGLVSRVWRDFKRGYWQYVAYDLLFKIIVSATLAPVAAWATGRLLSAAGPAVSNEDILSFALSPLGLATFLFAGSVGLASAYVEDAGLTHIANGVATGKSTSALEALWVTVKKFPSLLGLGLTLLSLTTLALAPFVALIAMAYALLLTGSDINFIIAEKPPEFWIFTALLLPILVGALLVGVRLSMRWIFVIAAIILDGTRPPAALRRSWKLARREWTRVVGTVFTWGFIVAAVTWFATQMLNRGTDFVLDRIGDDIGLAIIAMASIGFIALLGAFFITFFWITVHCLLVVHLRLELTGGEAAPAAVPEEPEPLPVERESLAYRLAPALSIALVVLGLAGATVRFVRNLDLHHDVYVTAHRGSSLAAPENSLTAIEEAIDDGADFAEIDVQETADSVVVLLHDADLMRVSGVNAGVHELSYDSIRRLDAGSWFAPSFAGEHIPTLQEAIDLARGRIRLMIELKPHGSGESLASRVVQIVDSAGYADEALIMSLDYASVEKVRELDPDLEVGYLIFRTLGDPSHLDVDYLSVNRWIATQDLVKSTRRNEKELHVWTINDRKAMSAQIDLGVDNIITDDPALLRAVLDERAALSDVETALIVFRNWLRHGR